MSECVGADGLGFVSEPICDVVEDQEVEAVEPVEGGFEGELLPCGLQLLDKIGVSGEGGGVSVLEPGEANRGGEMTFACTRMGEASGMSRKSLLLGFSQAGNTNSSPARPGRTSHTALQRSHVTLARAFGEPARRPAMLARNPPDARLRQLCIAQALPRSLRSHAHCWCEPQSCWPGCFRVQRYLFSSVAVFLRVAYWAGRPGFVFWRCAARRR